MIAMDSPTISNKEGREPLISSPRGHYIDESKKKKSLFLVGVKWILEMSILAVSISWVVLVFLFSILWFNQAYDAYINSASSTDTITEKAFLLFSSQFLIIVFLALARQLISDSLGEEQNLQLQKLGSVKPGYKLHTFPVMVDGLLGVVSAAESIGIIIVIVYLIWTFILHTIDNVQVYADVEDKTYHIFRHYGEAFGDGGSFTLSLLFLPVARGSPFLRLINVSFEHVTKYHIWLGNLTMVLFTLHGISMAISRTAEDGYGFLSIFWWASDGVAVVAGVIALVIGILMWITSIRRIRRKYFETFYYTHQLYVCFVIFLVLHVGDFYSATSIAGGVFVYMIDRFLRFYHSRKVVDIVSIKYHSCGVVELALAKPPNLRYDALSSIFVRIEEVSRLQWHPFSVSSTPLDGKDHVSVMIKVEGEWTRKLESKVLSMLQSKDGESQPFKLTAFVEGPYGLQLPYYVKYTDLVLVTGGIGITPFLAMINDILHRVKGSKPCRTRNILLVWAIKRSDELQLLSQISSCFSNDLVNLETRIFVTREPTPSYEHGNILQYISPATSHRGISSMAGMGNTKWLAMYFLLCFIGLVIFRALSDIFRLSFAVGAGAWWYTGVVLLATMVAAVVIPGGLALRLWEAKAADSSVSADADVATDREEEGNAIEENVTSVKYGSRPKLGDIFESVHEAKGHVEVGVIVCGPPSLDSSAAAQCRRLNFRRKGHEPIFHFHSHSYSS